jgi:hypothetical protein
MTSVTINGNTYTDDSNPSTGFGNGGHRTKLTAITSDIVVVAGEVAADQVTVAADKAIVVADKAIVAADKATVIADKGIVNTDKGIVAADKATVAADKAIVIADKATVLTYKTDAQTAATTATTQAGLAATSAIDAAADAAAADADRVTVAADKGIVAADKATVIADKAIVAADKATVAADKAIVAADKATTLGYKNDAATSAGNAATSETNAAASAAAAAAIVDLLRTVSTNLTATGSDQSGALALTTDDNICTTVAASTGVKLMAKPATGAKIINVMNWGANPLKVYPASGESFNGLAANAPITLAVGGILEARSDTTTRWSVKTNQFTDLIANGSLALADQNITGLKTLVMSAPQTITTTTGAVTLDFTLGSLKLQNEFTGAVTYTFTAPAAYSRIQIFLASDGTSTAYGITWPASVKWLGSAFTTTTANKAAMVNGFYDGTNYWMMGSSEV